MWKAHILFYFVNAYFIYSFANLLINDDNSYNAEHMNVLACIFKMISNKDPVLIILNSTQFENNSKLYQIDKPFLITKRFEIISSFDYISVVILLTDSLQDVDDYLKLFSGIKLTTVKFIVGYFGMENFDIIFELALMYSILNMNLVVNNYIYTYFPYEEVSCRNNKLKILSKCENNITDYFPKKIPQDLNKCPLRLLAYPMEPYVMKISSLNFDKPHIVGLEVTIVQVIAQKMNLDPVFIHNNHEHWGFQLSDGKYTLMYKDLFNKKADLMFGFIYGNASYSKDFEASHFHLLDASVWWVPVALQIQQWKNILAIYQRTLWIILGITLPVIGFVWWIFGRNDLITCILEALYVLLQGSLKDTKTLKTRFLLILWIISSLLLFTAYQSQLVSILTQPIYEKQISNLEDLVKSSLKIGFYPTVAQGFNDSKNYIHQQVANRYLPCPLTNECINRTAYKRDFATFKNQRSGLYLIPRYFTYPNGRSMLYKFEEFGILSVIRFIAVKNWPLLEKFNWYITHLQASGLMSKWDNDIKNSGYKFQKDQEQKNKTLNLNHLLFAFYVLYVGIVLSSFVLTLEILCFKVFRNKLH